MIYIAKRPVTTKESIETLSKNLVNNFFSTLKDSIESVTGIRNNKGTHITVLPGNSFQLSGLSITINPIASTKWISIAMDMLLSILLFPIWFYSLLDALANSLFFLSYQERMDQTIIPTNQLLISVDP